MASQWKIGLGLLALALGVWLCVSRTLADPPVSTELTSTPAFDNRTSFLLFWRENDAATQAAKRVLTDALAPRGGQAVTRAVNVTDPAEKLLVDRYRVDRSPMPLIIAVASNGAVTGAFPMKVTAEDVTRAFASPALAQCLKAVQDRKLVLLCVYDSGTSLPDGVRDFKADPKFGPVTEIVAVRADDAGEQALLKRLQIDARGKIPVVGLVAPPGRLLGAFSGAVTKQQLIDRVTAPQGCCPGGKCGPGGCCTPRSK